MNIFSFKRMRIYRSEGRTHAMLSVALPHTDEDGLCGTSFNGFYTKIFEEYGSACEKIEPNESEGIIKISADFEVLPSNNANLVRIKRRLTVSGHNTRKNSEVTDVFDISLGMFTG